jgi:seryl-tRNA synthetase
LKVLDRFAANGTKDPTIFAEMSTPKNVLRHACCVPVYQFLAGERIAPGVARAFLVSGRCFRNEAANVVELARLNEFFMKEYVFLGEPNVCREAIGCARKLWDFWITTFALNCKIDTANDSFFASNHKKLSYFQQIGESKQEFKWLVPSLGDYVACSSINSHRTHFTKPYSITSPNGDLCYSSCIAFGIDRLAYALLAQKGLDPEAWDEATRAEINTYVKLQSLVSNERPKHPQDV